MIAAKVDLMLSCVVRMVHKFQFRNKLLTVGEVI